MQAGFVDSGVKLFPPTMEYICFGQMQEKKDFALCNGSQCPLSLEVKKGILDQMSHTA